MRRILVVLVALVMFGCSDNDGAANLDLGTVDGAKAEMSVAPEAGRDLPSIPDKQPTDRSPLDMAADSARDLASDVPADLPLAVDAAPPPDLKGDVLQTDGWFTNTKCTSSQKVPLSSGTATVTGNTTGCKNEFGTSSIFCGTTVSMEGPQRYYTVSMKKGTHYALTLKPSFKAHLYVFMESDCSDPADIDLSCSSGGPQGSVIGPVAKGSSQTLTITPLFTGNYIIAVDSGASSLAGAFSLDITELSPATHSTCVKAKPVALTGSTTLIKGNTGVVKDEYPGLSCKGSIKLTGPQLYWVQFLSDRVNTIPT